MSKLPEQVKLYVVQALACFDAPTAVANAVKREFGITISRQAVEQYDLGKAASKSTKWHEIFATTRGAFLDDAAKIGISHRNVRLRVLNRMVDRAEALGNIALAAALLEQAAKEVGGFYTNRRELTGKDGRDLASPMHTIQRVIIDPGTVFHLPDNGRGDASSPSGEAR